jgi:threonine/homoserine/homoserine lactone efflux protein
MDSVIFIRGIMIGFLAAVPIGPINVLCIQRTLNHGRIIGFVSGLGAATIDALYGGIAWIGLSTISHILSGYHLWISLLGGTFLFYLGIRIIAAKYREHASSDRDAKNFVAAYTSTLFLTLANPSTIFSYGLLLAVFGGEHLHRGIGSASLLVPGVFIGSAVWWAALSGIVGMIRSRMNATGLKWVNRISGAIVAGAGLYILLKLL